MPTRVCLHDAELKLMQTKVDCLQAKIVELSNEKRNEQPKSLISDQLTSLKMKYRQLQDDLFVKANTVRALRDEATKNRSKLLEMTLSCEEVERENTRLGRLLESEQGAFKEYYENMMRSVTANI